MQETNPLARKKDLVIQELDNEVLIYDLQNNKVFGLNETSALVWQLSNGERTIGEISQIVNQKMNCSISADFVWLALNQLSRENLIKNEIPNNFQGATRREVIKRIGFASMVTLPLISSILAPTSLHAQSSSCGTAPNIALGCSCVVGGLSNSSNCASQCCNFVTASLPGVCVPMGGALGADCVRACQCDSGCCGRTGFGCVAPNSKPIGSPCVFSCECNCLAGMCV